MKALAFAVAALLLWPAVAGAYIDDIGAKLVVRTLASGDTEVTITAIVPNDASDFGGPVQAVWVEFGPYGDDGNVRLHLSHVSGDRWFRRIKGLVANETSEIAIWARDLHDEAGRLLACTRETPRRVVCRGGPQP